MLNYAVYGDIGQGEREREREERVKSRTNVTPQSATAEILPR